jgi:hypothetical protein
VAIRKFNALPQLDYDPICGERTDISFGIVEAAELPTGRRRLEDVVAKRLFPVERPSPGEPWPEPTAHRSEVLLPRGASDHLADPRQLCSAFHAKVGGQIQHLAAVLTIRFDQVDEVPQRVRLHEAIELGRGFGLRLTRFYGTAVVFCVHVPATNWGMGVPHSHLILPVRKLLPGSGFSTFIKALIDPEVSRPTIDAEWASWLQESGF